MKTGKSIQQLAAEIARQSELKKDFVANTKQMECYKPAEQDAIVLNINGAGIYSINEIAHRQIADRLDIPLKYYNRMQQEAPQLLTTNINHWFDTQPEDRMIRTLHTDARAFLSNRYRRLDNMDLMEAILPTLADIPRIKVISCELTESRLYLKVLTEQLETEISPGDVVQAGIVITNSEVGLGAFKVEPLIYRLVCKNGMISADYSMKKYHVGRKTVLEENMAMELFSDETLLADDRAFWLKARDVVKGAFRNDAFLNIVNNMRVAGQQKVQGDPVKAVQELAKRTLLTQEETGGVLRHLIDGGDLSKLGMANAVTRLSQDVENYDRATELERLGGKIIVLDKSEWKVISEAA